MAVQVLTVGAFTTFPGGQSVTVNAGSSSTGFAVFSQPGFGPVTTNFTAGQSQTFVLTTPAYSLQVKCLTGTLTCSTAYDSPVPRSYVQANTSGSSEAYTINSSVTPASASTLQQSSMTVRSQFAGPAAIAGGGWLTAIQGVIDVNAADAASVDKATVYTSRFSIQGGSDVNTAAGMEFIFQGAGPGSNAQNVIGFLVANSAAVPGRNQVANFNAFAALDPGSDYLGVGRYMKTMKTDTATVSKELAPPMAVGYVANRYYYTPGCTGNFVTAATVATVVYLSPFQVTERTTFTKIGCNVTAAVAGNLHMGIWYCEAGIPTTRILDTGDISHASTGAKEYTGSFTLEVGTYAIGVQTSGAPTLNFLTNYEGRSVWGNTTATGDENGANFQPGVYAAFPATAPTLQYATASNQVPAIWLRK